MLHGALLEAVRKTIRAYENASKPLCARLGLPQTALEILLFLANNPDRNTAREIVEMKKLKANLVSVNVEKLVSEGYLERGPDAQDRRKTILTCTAKAAPVIAQGRQMREAFARELLRGVPEENLTAMREAFQIISNNIDELGRKI